MPAAGEAAAAGENAQRGIGVGLDERVQRPVPLDGAQRAADDGRDARRAAQVRGRQHLAGHHAPGAPPDDLVEQLLTVPGAPVQRGPADAEAPRQ